MARQLFPQKYYSYSDIDKSEEARKYFIVRHKLLKKFEGRYGWPTCSMEYITEMMAGERNWPSGFRKIELKEIMEKTDGKRKP